MSFSSNNNKKLDIYFLPLGALKRFQSGFKVKKIAINFLLVENVKYYKLIAISRQLFFLPPCFMGNGSVNMVLYGKSIC